MSFEYERRIFREKIQSTELCLKENLIKLDSEASMKDFMLALEYLEKCRLHGLRALYQGNK